MFFTLNGWQSLAFTCKSSPPTPPPPPPRRAAQRAHLWKLLQRHPPRCSHPAQYPEQITNKNAAGTPDSQNGLGLSRKVSMVVFPQYDERGKCYRPNGTKFGSDIKSESTCAWSRTVIKSAAGAEQIRKRRRERREKLSSTCASYIDNI